METISQREFRNGSAAVLNAVEGGTTFRITRNGTPVAELRPLSHRRLRTAEELVERHRHLPRLDHTRMRAEADEAFADGLSDDPFERPRG